MTANDLQHEGWSENAQAAGNGSIVEFPVTGCEGGADGAAGAGGELHSGGSPVRLVRQVRRRHIVLHLGPNEIEHVLKEYFGTDFPGRRPSTINMAKFWMGKFVQWMRARHLNHIDAGVLQEFIEHLSKGRKYGTMDQGWRAVKRFLRWLKNTGYVDEMPHEGVRMPINRKSEPIRAATPEEYRKLLKACGEHWMSWAVMLGWNTGMSIADCMKLKWQDVDMQNCLIKIKRLKTGTPALIPFDPAGELGRRLLEMHKAHGGNPEPNSYVCKEAGYRIKENAPQFALSGLNSFTLLAERAGMKGFTFHMLRRAFVSALANSGMNLALACKVTGHSSPEVFAQYVRPDTDAIRRGVLDALDSSGVTREVESEDPPGVFRKSPSGLFMPNRVYLARRGKVHMPDGSPVSFVKTGSDAEGRMAVVIPCDEDGVPTSDTRLVVDFSDVRAFN